MGYPHGLFTWTDIGLPDPAAGSRFYSELFGWSAEDQQDEEGNYIYTMFSKDGKSAAGLGPQPPNMAASGIPPMWTSYITVDDVDATVAAWTDAGGTTLMPVMDVMTAGRMALVADPEGAVMALWQAGDSVGGEVFNEPGALTWNELNTRDSAAARAFFGKVLGWDFEQFEADGPVPFEYWMIRVEGKTGGPPFTDDKYNGGFMTMDENWPADLPAHWMVYFQVDNTDETCARLEQLGGKVSVPPFDSSAGRIAVVGDPQGGTFSIITPNAPPT